MKDITSRCCTKLAKNAEDIYFIYKGAVLDENSNIKQIKNNSDGAKILVFNRNDQNDKIKEEENLVDSKDVICPICGENCLINIKNYKIELNKCLNGHSLQNIYFNEFKNIQKINEAKVICNNCHKKKLKFIIMNYISVVNAISIYVHYVKANITKSILFLIMN